MTRCEGLARLHKVLAAHGDIAVIAANLSLRAVYNRPARGVYPQVHRRFAAAMAGSLDFDEVIRKPQQRRRPRKKLHCKIRAQALTQHGNLGLIRDPRQLQNLRAGQKLRLIEHHASQRSPPMLFHNRIPKLGVWIKFMCICTKPDP
jgi:hypothetical protein